MNNIYHDIKVLRKILNSELFLGKYPVVKRVWVDAISIENIDIVLSVDESSDEYWDKRYEIESYIYNLAKMAGVTRYFRVHP